MTLIHERQAGVCDICRGPCTGVPTAPYLETYPFLPGGEPVRSPDMPDDVVVTERIFHEGVLVATPGDRIKAEDARKWGVGSDGRMQSGVTVAEPVPEHAEKRPTARTRARRRGENRGG